MSEATFRDALLWLNDRLGREMTVAIYYRLNVRLAVTGQLMRFDYLSYSIGRSAQPELPAFDLRDTPGAVRIEEDGDDRDLGTLVIDLGADESSRSSTPKQQ